MKKFDLEGTILRKSKSEIGKGEMSRYKLIPLLFVSMIIALIGIQMSTYWKLRSLKSLSYTSEGVSAKLREAKNQYSKITKAHAGIEQGRTLAEVLKTISSVIPNTIRLESVTFEKNKPITIKGIARSNVAITLFINQLQQHLNKLITMKTVIRIKESGCFAFTMTIGNAQNKGGYGNN